MTAGSSPGERSFFKYVAPDTALAILTNKTFRYSSPILFNDPFDIQSGLHFDFDLGTLNAKILEGVERAARSPTKPNVDTSDPWGQILDFVWKHFPTRGFPRERWEALTADALEQLKHAIREAQRQYQDVWRTMLPTLRVFCVSEDPANLLMWAHYAKDHTGAVLELRSLPELDNPLSVAQPISYVDAPPPFFTEAEWLNNLLGQQPLDRTAMFHRYARTKSSHWAYEKEWRVWYPASAPAVGLFVDTPIRDPELAAVHIGCRATKAFESSVKELMRSSFPKARLFRAHKAPDAFAVTYTEL